MAENNDSRCRTCKHRRNCINGMWCTVLEVYVEYARMDGCEHYDIDSDNRGSKVGPNFRQKK